MEQSTKAYEPGTVAVATVRGVEGVRVFATLTRADGTLWRHAEIQGRWATHDYDVTDLRPLVVVDLGDYDNRAVTYLRNIARGDLAYDGNPTPRAKLVDLIADQIEAQAKPPRIPEPGPWGVVEAGVARGERFTFVRTAAQGSGDWICVDDGALWSWRNLIDPTLVREGVES